MTTHDTATLLHDATVEVVNRAQELLGLTHGATSDDSTCSDPACPCQGFARKEVEQPRPQLWADAATVRAAVMDVIDSGDEDERQWFLYERISTVPLSNWNEDAANEERSKFADAVFARVAQLQQPPHDYPQMRQLCDSHKRRRLPTYSGECVDCKRERS